MLPVSLECCGTLVALPNAYCTGIGAFKARKRSGGWTNQTNILYRSVTVMRFKIRGWFLLSITVALAASHVGRIWSPATGTFLTQPMWVFEESCREENEHALDLLRAPAPEIDTNISVRELVRILQYEYHLNVDPDDVTAFARDRYVNRRFHGQKLGDWLLDVWAPQKLDLIVQRGMIQVVEQQRTHEDGKRMVRIYPCPKVSSDSLIQSIESNCGDSNWIAYGGEDSISVIDNDHQSLLVVSTDYSTHLRVESLLKNLYKTSGIGWRSEAFCLKQLPNAFTRRLTLWLDPPKTPSVPSTSFGTGCLF